MRVSLLSPVALAACASAKIWYAGVDESGGEFGVYSANATKGTGLPGTFGVDYAFLNQTTADIWVDQNHINLFRVAFLLERMCPLEYGLGSKFNETYFGYYNDAIEYITVKKGVYAILGMWLHFPERVFLIFPKIRTTICATTTRHSNQPQAL